MKIIGVTAIVTGASRGIGLATAHALHRRGASVGLIARNGEELAQVGGALGDRCAWAVADVADGEALEAAIAQIAGQLGPVDILVNNAGIGAYAAVLEETNETFEHLIRVNYLGTVSATRAVLPAMAERGRGHIVNVASVAGRVGAPFEAAYSASKFAVVGFTESLAAEVQGFGISLSLVNPGPVETHFTEARGVAFQRKYPRPLGATRIADAVVAAIEDDRFEQTLPRWLRTGSVVRAIAPGLYRRGLLRDSRREARSLVRRVRAAER